VLLPGASSDHSALLARLERLERAAQSAGPAARATDDPGIPAPAFVPAPSVPASSAPAPDTPAPSPPAAGAGPAAGPADAPDVPAETSAGAAGGRKGASRRAPGVAASPRTADPAPSAAPAAAPDVPAPPRPGSRRGQTAGPRPAAAAPPSDAQSLRDDWESVLDAVKRVRRAAWWPLRTATVQSLVDGVLTVRFARAGDMKGFVSSESDADLERVLVQSFGLKVKVRAVSGPAEEDPPDRGASTGAVRENPGNSPRTAPPPARAQQPEPARGARPQPADPEAAAAGHGPGDGDPFDVRDPDASAGDDALTGIDLIKRELGGQIVDETDHG
jgi:DNA polymerase III subunit gamma/tau